MDHQKSAQTQRAYRGIRRVFRRTNRSVAILIAPALAGGKHNTKGAVIIGKGELEKSEQVEDEAP